VFDVLKPAEKIVSIKFYYFGIHTAALFFVSCFAPYVKRLTVPNAFHAKIAGFYQALVFELLVQKK
jgi:hypothetical protein